MHLFYTRKNWDTLHGPCIYRFLDENKHPLYIGFSDRGLSRVFYHGRSGYAKRRAAAIDVAQFIEVVFFDTKEEALATETEEIHKYHPKYQSCITCYKRNN